MVRLNLNRNLRMLYSSRICNTKRGNTLQMGSNRCLRTMRTDNGIHTAPTRMGRIRMIRTNIRSRAICPICRIWISTISAESRIRPLGCLCDHVSRACRADAGAGPSRVGRRDFDVAYQEAPYERVWLGSRRGDHQCVVHLGRDLVGDAWSFRCRLYNETLQNMLGGAGSGQGDESIAA